MTSSGVGAENEPAGGPVPDRWDSPRVRHLVESVLDLMVEQGFHETSVREIAAAAGWNMATLYHYVADKRDLLYYIERWIYEQISDYLATCRSTGPDAASRLESLIDCYYRMTQKFAKHIRFLLRETNNFKPEHRPLIQQHTLDRVETFRRLIALGVDSGEFRAIDPEMAAREIYFLAWSWAINATLITTVGDFEQYLRFTKDFILAGLRATPA